MWTFLRHAAVVGLIHRFLRPRWKRLAACFAIVLLTLYVHAEYLNYLEALPEAEASRASYVGWAFALKNVTLATALVVAVLPDVLKRRATSLESNRGRAQSPDSGEGDQETTGAEPDPTDPFGKIRRKPALQTRADQLLKGKR